MKKIFTFILSAAAFYGIMAAGADFAPVFSSGMVLQQGRDLSISGSAAPESKITLEFAGHKVSSIAGKDGKWVAVLPPLKASATPRSMTLSSAEGSKKLDDILVGEVWLCSGQSNMNWRLSACINGKETAAASDFPQIRFLRLATKPQAKPLEKFTNTWQRVTPKNAGTISGVAYYFVRKLHQELNVPIGLLCAHLGGTMIEPWTPAGAWDKYPELKAKLAKQFSEPVNPKANSPKVWAQNQPHVLYNAAIHPMTPYTFRGVIWYQGCSNVWYDSSNDYLLKQQALFDSWKKAFRNPDMKFYLVQLAPLRRGGNAAKNHVGIWLAQQEFADKNHPAVQMAVINDVGDLKDIHPKNKAPVGLRLANIALKYDYNMPVAADFPRLKTCTKNGSSLLLTFTHAKSWKTIDGKAVKNFEVAGPDGKFVPAAAVVDGANLLVSSPAVAEPAAVRYMFNCSRIGNLVNENGLPLGTFKAAVRK